MSGGLEIAGNFNNGSGGGELTSSFVESGGTLVVATSGAAEFTTVELGGVLLELAGFTGITSLHGTQFVGGGLPGVPPPTAPQSAVAAETTIYSGGQQIVGSNGHAVGSIVEYGGSVKVLTGGVSTRATVSGGSLSVLGGVARDVEVDSGGLAVAARFGNGRTDGTLDDALVHSGGVLVTGVLGIASSAMIDSGGLLLELAGLTSNVSLAGVQVVGGRLPGVPAPAKVPRAVALDTTVSSGGVLVVNSNGRAVDTQVLSGGEIVLNGGPINSLSLSSGGTIGLAALAFNSSETISFTEIRAGTQGTVTVSSGGRSVSITLLGQYAAAGFRLSEDKTGGTAITYEPPTSQIEIAAGHH